MNIDALRDRMAYEKCNRFLQTLLFTWESVWKKNEFEKSSILEIFHKYDI